MFQGLQALPQDPLLGLITKFHQDERAEKIDLGVGVYKDERGLTPVLECVKTAEEFLLSNEDSKSYVGPSGNVHFSELMAKLVFAETYDKSLTHRLSSLQTPGGCGALRVLAELITRAAPTSNVWLSDPTWANHVPLLGDANIELKKYPYYDYQSKSIRFDEMIESLANALPGDVVLLHACCHNPSGADLSEEQWRTIVNFLHDKKLVPLIDVAYQGFGLSLDKDAYGIRLAAEKLDEIMVAVSCSKNFGLYRERVGCAFVLSKNINHADASKSHLLNIARGIYSMPPSHGASIVELILSSEELKSVWTRELLSMRYRISQMRDLVAENMNDLIDDDRFDFVARQNGMFSFLGIDEFQVKRLASDHGIYMAGNSRVSIAGLNESNMKYFSQSLSQVL